ncbi:MAG: hypothetical protein KGK03_05910 [Candidatus Omnitrophica bacterium]|nr:hypothetical protein [Candidatus Omnitrophota bacterium]MDE2222588.1 hypothetical protein [Candidatus Omnitrophota bacterium]
MLSRVLLLMLVGACIFPQNLRAETIYYDIHQIGFNGQASLSMVGPKDFKEHKTLLIQFKAHGRNYWDNEDIYVDPVTYKPLFVERNFSLSVFGQGKISEDYVTSKGQILITKTDGNRVTHQTINNVGDVDNIYGFIYRYRKEGSFKIGDTIDMTLPTRDLKIRLLKKTRLRLGRKSYYAYYMVSRPTRYKIWFDTTKRKWPLKITGTVGLFNSVMTMTGYDE